MLMTQKTVQKKLRFGNLHLSAPVKNLFFNKFERKTLPARIGATLAAIRFNSTEKGLMISLFYSACYKPDKNNKYAKTGRTSFNYI